MCYIALLLEIVNMLSDDGEHSVKRSEKVSSKMFLMDKGCYAKEPFKM